MARKKKHSEEHENHERWLVSYADFITLLFAFFVVMYAISSVNESKYRMLTQSIGIAFGGPAKMIVDVDRPADVTQQPVVKLPSRKERARMAEIRREKERMTAIGRDLIQALNPLINQGMVRVLQTPRGVNVEINASVLFASGNAQLSPQSEEIIKAVAKVLRTAPNIIQVEGFTDDAPINTALFPSNWELSAVRASTVVRLLIDSGIPEARLIAVGRGANDPVETNDTPEGRSRNRRVQLMVMSAIPEEAKEVTLPGQ